MESFDCIRPDANPPFYGLDRYCNTMSAGLQLPNPSIFAGSVPGEFAQKKKIPSQANMN